MKLKINGTEYTLKYSLRAVIVFERITGKAFEIATATDQYVFLYSLIIACNPTTELTFDQMLDALDEDPKLLLQYAEYLQETFHDRAERGLSEG